MSRSGQSTPLPAKNKVVLVTGASAGIGAALGHELARRGYHLILTARRTHRLEQLADELRPLGVDVVTVPADLGDPAAAERLVSEAQTRFGGLDVLINNAGFGLPTLFADAEPEDLRRQLEINLVAPLLLTRAALPLLLERRGTIINIGSAITCVANSGLGAYGATKAGLAYWNNALRRELRHKGVKVCLVEPGPVKTEFFAALSQLAPPGGRYNPLLDAPMPWMSARVEEVAFRIAQLIERPRRRLSVLRRVVWPFRVLGVLFQICPPLGDLALSSMTRHFDRLGDLSRSASTVNEASSSK
jgi:short-subunit dehydrogenase